mgnify:CR=1 FL=1
MSYKLFLNTLIILTIIITTCICVMKPQMHKSVLVYNSEYQLVPKQEVTVEQKDLPTMPAQPEQKVIEQKVTETPQVQNVNIEPKVIHIFKNTQSTPKVETQTQTSKVAQPPQQKIVQTTQTKPIQTQTKNDYNIDVKQIAQRTAQNVTPPKINTNTTTSPAITTNPSTRIQYTPAKKTETKTSAPVQTTTKPPSSTPIQQKVLTAQEEEILWNKWRSNLQNQIMIDVKLPTIPTGTVFRFSFNVDKYGKITNVQTWSDTSKYTPYAIQYIAPVIRSYQGKSILNFPTGSNRTSTEVKGGWKISANAKFSTPQDYNDTERITK